MNPHSLTVQNFRAYPKASWHFTGPIVYLTGPNGSGKTTILEALSLLSPGRGLRRAKSQLIQHRPSADLLKNQTNTVSNTPWKVHAFFHLPSGPLSVETIGEEGARSVYVNDAKLRSQMELSQWFIVQWITPAMDKIWTEGWSCRRTYFDRWVFTVYPEYGPLILQYEKLRHERQRLLQDGGAASWISSVERLLAEHMIQLYLLRVRATEALEQEVSLRSTRFPTPTFRLQGEAEEIFRAHTFPDSALPVLLQKLQDTRPGDRHRKTTQIGIHRTQVEIWYCTPEAPPVEAAFCSTGEQKRLLLSIGLGLARLAQKDSPHKFSLLLLDDVVAHLDAEGRALLLEEISTLGGITWMTSAEASLFPHVPKAEHLTLPPVVSGVALSDDAR